MSTKPTAGPVLSTGSRIRLGELLVKAGVISEAQLKTALQEQKQWGGKLGDILVRMRYVSEDVFVRALSKQLGLQRADLSQPIALEALARVPAELAEEYEIVPVAMLDEGRTLVIATADPLNVTAQDSVRSVTRARVVAQVAGASAIRAAIARLYQGAELRGGADEPLKIVNNSEDTVNVPASAPPPPPVQPNRSMPTPAAGVAPFVMTQQYQAPNRAQPTPAFGYPNPYAGQLTPAMPIPVQPQPAQGGDRIGQVEESQRREVAALKALVELLVQKGVISLDEYLARLKR